MGPIDLLVVKFPGNHFHGELAPRLAELVESGIIRIIDLVFVGKDGEGNVLAFEINELPQELQGHWGSMTLDEAENVGLNEEDIQSLAAGLEPNSSGALLLFENTWAIGFKQALENADAQVLLFERIPGVVIEELEIALAGGAA
jgi:hypothetical protein